MTDTKPQRHSRANIEKEITFLSNSTSHHKCRTAAMLQQLLDDQGRLLVELKCVVERLAATDGCDAITARILIKQVTGDE